MIAYSPFAVISDSPSRMTCFSKLIKRGAQGNAQKLLRKTVFKFFSEICGLSYKEHTLSGKIYRMFVNSSLYP